MMIIAECGENSRSISVDVNIDAETVFFTVTAHRNHQYKRTEHASIHDAKQAYNAWNGIPEEASA